MKKIWKVTAATLAMAFCFTGLFACDKGDAKGKEKVKEGEGAIAGTYTEVTSEKQQEKLTQKLAAINFDNMMGDTEAADWYRGITLTYKNEIEFEQGAESLKTNGNGAVKLHVGNGANDTLDFAASVEMSQSLTATKQMAQMLNLLKEGATGDAKLSLTEKAYIDMSYIYLDTGLTGENVAYEEMAAMFGGKKKISMLSISELLGGMLGGMLGGVEGMNAQMSTAPSVSAVEVAALMSTLKSFEIELSVDYSDGLKIKLETTDNSWSLLKTYIMAQMGGFDGIDPTSEELGGGAMTAMSILDALDLDAEMFVHFGENGELKQAAMKLECGMSQGENENKTEADVEISLNLKVTSEKVTLPAEIATDTNYEELDLSLLFGEDDGEDGGLEGDEMIG